MDEVVGQATESRMPTAGKLQEAVRRRRAAGGPAESTFAALVGLDIRDLHDDPEVVQETLMCLLKTQEDKARLTREVTARLLGKVA